jgi:MurNAc alpha-1-phosphate uridylyltransferase
MKPGKAFILAAGFGTRLRPLTETCPKPLIPVAGRTLLDRTLDHLEDTGVHSVVINTHYLAGQIENHCVSRQTPKIILSHEPVLLDTGGGIKKALGQFGQDPFFVLSGDGLWTDGPGETALGRMAACWDPKKMDILMLLQRVADMTLTQGAGDYDLDIDGRAVRSLQKGGAYMFTSIRINAPAIFRDTPDGAFSYLELLDRAERAGRLYGLVHTGAWHHISTPADLMAVETAFSGHGTAL